MKKYTFLLLCLTVLLTACKDKTEIEEVMTDFGYDYFPLEIGKYRIYQVDSIVYDIGSGGLILKNTNQVFVRERITDTLQDNLGQTTYRIERSTRSDENESWEIKDIWLALNTAEQAEQIEENLRFIKLIFPIKQGEIWDPTRFIDNTTIIPVAGESVEVFKSWSSEVISLKESGQIGSLDFEDVLTVLHADSENVIERRYVEERYARGVGLIFKSQQILDTQCIVECEGQTWEQKAEKGFILTQRLIEYN